jgi:hypothetical protein
MDKIEFITIKEADGIEREHAIFYHEDGSFTSMLKSAYLEWQAAQTPNA